jgi:hypothetical protein
MHVHTQAVTKPETMKRRSKHHSNNNNKEEKEEVMRIKMLTCMTHIRGSRSRSRSWTCSNLHQQQLKKHTLTLGLLTHKHQHWLMTQRVQNLLQTPRKHQKHQQQHHQHHRLRTQQLQKHVLRQGQRAQLRPTMVHQQRQGQLEAWQEELRQGPGQEAQLRLTTVQQVVQQQQQRQQQGLRKGSVAAGGRGLRLALLVVVFREVGAHSWIILAAPG